MVDTEDVGWRTAFGLDVVQTGLVVGIVSETKQPRGEAEDFSQPRTWERTPQEFTGHDTDHGWPGLSLHGNGMCNPSSA